MPRRLPPLPSLEHLKKDAKQLRRELREQRPDARLSEAQYAVAKRYGFASWPRLKAHVAALQPDALNARLVGTWTANRETFEPPIAAGRFRPAQMRFAVDSDLVAITYVRVDGLGREERGSYLIAADGREHPRGTSGWVAIARWIDNATFELAEMKNGDPGIAWRFRLSEDQRSVAVSVNRSAKSRRAVTFRRAAAAV
jgi:hypothetical protein